jgi:hypothetical protein
VDQLTKAESRKVFTCSLCAHCRPPSTTVMAADQGRTKQPLPEAAVQGSEHALPRGGKEAARLSSPLDQGCCAWLSTLAAAAVSLTVRGVKKAKLRLLRLTRSWRHRCVHIPGHRGTGGGGCGGMG